MNRPWLVVAATAALVVACAAARRVEPGSAKVGSSDGQRVSSNVLRRDYVGSAACRGCHSEIYDRFMRSPMHQMTRDAARAEITAPFEGERFAFKRDKATMERREGRRYMRVTSPERAEQLFLVTKVIGGRVREDFVGIEVEGSLASSRLLGDERILPVSFLKFDRSYRYKGYSVMTPERPELRAGSRWRTTCIFCHNSVPALSSLFDELYGDGSPVYQGSASIALPRERRFRFEIRDESGLERALSDELHLLHAEADSPRSTRDLLAAAIAATRRRFGERQLLELGIGCEACHGGAHEHLADPNILPTFALRSELFSVSTPSAGELSPAQNVNRACLRCHTVLFTQYPHTWEGKSRNQNPGGATINSGEARDFLLGGCTSRLGCTSCHDPHGDPGHERLARLDGRGSNAICTSCHSKLGAPEALRAHAHHAPDGPGGVCVDCHMPKKNMGLAYDLTRYHRIASPTERQKVEGDRPLECALCHAEKSVRWTLSALERLWGKRYDRAALERLYGPNLDVNVLAATLVRGKSHERATAAGVVGQKRLTSMLPELVGVLGDDYPLVRFFAKIALERATGEKLPLDMHASGSEIVAAGQRWLELRDRYRAPSASAAEGPRPETRPSTAPQASGE